jgi:hypothetical protein
MAIRHGKHPQAIVITTVTQNDATNQTTRFAGRHQIEARANSRAFAARPSNFLLSLAEHLHHNLLDAQSPPPRRTCLRSPGRIKFG